MAGRGPQTFKKRQKEQQRKERQQEKAEKRMQRKLENPSGGFIIEERDDLDDVALDRPSADPLQNEQY
jgi:hypothetical protein